MWIPLNTKTARDLGLSVIRLNEGYSVAIMAVVDGYGMVPMPSYELHHDEDSVACMTDYEVVKGADLYECIEKCLKQLDK